MEAAMTTLTSSRTAPRITAGTDDSQKSVAAPAPGGLLPDRVSRRPASEGGRS
jgi:hypothetical protein